jgi:hypothetical protein
MAAASLAARVLERKDELEDAYAELDPHDASTRVAIATALAAVYPLVTGDLAHPPDVVGRALTRWLEANKHVALDVTRRVRARRALIRR